MANPLKWSGSKRVHCPQILSHFPKKINTFYEPFCGSCAVTLGLLEQSDIEVGKVICSDVNHHLIDLWRGIVNFPYMVARSYHSFWFDFNNADEGDLVNNRKRVYEEERRKLNSNTDIPCYATPFLNVLRTSFNGLVRYNGKGEFNSPCHFTRPGMEPSKLEQIILDASSLLGERHTTFVECSYQEHQPKEGDFLFLDPPYADSTNAMYYGSIDEDTLVEYLNALPCGYALTYGKLVDGVPNSSMAERLNGVKVYGLKASNSSFSRLKNKTSVIEEAMFVKM